MKESISVKSSMINSAEYDAANASLEIEFKNGSVTAYSDVPESVWAEFGSAESQGKFFNSNIKTQYAGARVNGDNK